MCYSRDHRQWQRVIHTGETSTVMLCCLDGEVVACKAYAKQRMQPRHRLNLRRELHVLSHLRCLRVPGVIQLLHKEETQDAVLLFFRACGGGDLYRSMKFNAWSEERLRDQVVVPLLQVLAKLHAMGYVHRDIKPENIFFDDDGSLQLGDFGLTIDQRRERPISRVGTLDYMAPEVLAQPFAEEAAALHPSWLCSYDEKVDCWGVGVLVFEILTGRAPFTHPNPQVAAMKARFQAPPPLPQGVSAACCDFVRHALTQVPSKRPSAAQLLAHPWVAASAAAAADAAAAEAAAAALVAGGFGVVGPPVGMARTAMLMDRACHFPASALCTAPPPSPSSSSLSGSSDAATPPLSADPPPAPSSPAPAAPLVRGASLPSPSTPCDLIPEELELAPSRPSPQASCASASSSSPPSPLGSPCADCMVCPALGRAPATGPSQHSIVLRPGGPAPALAQPLLMSAGASPSASSRPSDGDCSAATEPLEEGMHSDASLELLRLASPPLSPRRECASPPPPPPSQRPPSMGVGLAGGALAAPGGVVHRMHCKLRRCCTAAALCNCNSGACRAPPVAASLPTPAGWTAMGAAREVRRRMHLTLQRSLPVPLPEDAACPAAASALRAASYGPMASDADTAAAQPTEAPQGNTSPSPRARQQQRPPPQQQRNALLAAMEAAFTPSALARDCSHEGASPRTPARLRRASTWSEDDEERLCSRGSKGSPEPGAAPIPPTGSFKWRRSGAVVIRPDIDAVVAGGEDGRCGCKGSSEVVEEGADDIEKHGVGLDAGVCRRGALAASRGTLLQAWVHAVLKRKQVQVSSNARGS